MEQFLQADERLDDLQYKNLKLIQKVNGFCFGIDAVLLSNFVDVKKDSRVLDLGTGTGIIPILIAGKTLAKSIVGIEIQKQMVEMANRSVKLNNLSDKVEILCEDINKAVDLFGKSCFDVITTNPPYIVNGKGLNSETYEKNVSRHEVLVTLEDIIHTSSKLLKPGGIFSMVHRPFRLVDIITLMRKYKIEPKILRFVHSHLNKKSNLILISGTKFGNPELKILEPLYVYNQNGTYTDEIKKIYGRGEV